MKKKLLLIGKGFCMGAADVVPGVSGGTMAFILGIYTELIDAIKSFDSTWLKSVFRFNVKQAISRPHFGFLIPLGIGVLGALLFFTRVVSIPELLRSEPELVYGLFFGLITGSILLLLRHMQGIKVIHWFFFLSGTVVGFIIFNLVPVTTPNAAWFIFLSGALAICAMILPGISGSFILLILNKYTYIFDAIGYFRFSVLVPFALGAATGLVLFSRVLSWLLHHYYRQTIMMIGGILAASLWVIWPFQHRVYETVSGSEKLISSTPVFPSSWNETALAAIIMIVIGFAVVTALDNLANRKKQIM